MKIKPQVEGSMTPRDKGQILWLKEQGKQIKTIAGITGFPMKWIKSVISTLYTWRNKHELIDEWLKYLEKTEGQNDGITKKEKTLSILSSSGERTTNKTGSGKRTVRRVPKHTNKRHRDPSRSGRQDSSENKHNKHIVDTLRESKDYVGE